MGKFLRITIAIGLLFTAAAHSSDIEFKFEIPPLPYPPTISEVENSDFVVGNETFTVSAKIESSVQKKGFCYVDGIRYEKIDDHPACAELSNWRQDPHPDVVPNPPDIKKVMVHYYYNGDTSNGSGSMEMTYDSGTKTATADIPVKTDLKVGDTITYYITAVDHFGNVASQVPDTGEAPCTPGTMFWTDKLSTPVWDTCQHVTQYGECSKIKDGTPTCSTSFTANDILEDTCGEPDNYGNQTVLSTPVNKVDVHGMSAGADSSYVCLRMGLGAPPPPTTDDPPIEGYLAIFFNPDLPDENPGDTHIENAYAITYAPEVQGSDPTLVRVLWDVECVSNPVTVDPLGCKIKSALPGDNDLSMGYKDGAVIFISKKSWGSHQLIGSTSKMSQIITLAGEINLSGDTMFWLVDMTNGLGFYHKNQIEVAVPPGCMVSDISTVCKKVDDGSSSACAQSASQPNSNTCEIVIEPTDATGIDKYRIYRTLDDLRLTELNKSDYLLTEINEDGSASYSYSDEMSGDDLDGRTRVYYAASVCPDGESTEEMIITAAPTADCTPEDWVAPESPRIVSVETPEGRTEACEVKWTADTISDPTIPHFYVLRDGGLITTQPVSAAEGSDHLSFPYYHLDDSGELTNGTTYSYAVRTEDKGGNFSPDATADCTPEDKEPPGNVTGILALNNSSTAKLRAKTTWNASEEEDIAGYRVYMCRGDEDKCDTQEEFSSISCDGQSGLIDGTSCEYSGFESGTDDNYTFYVEAEDISGNKSCYPIACGDCLSTAYITTVPDDCFPSFIVMRSLAAEAPPEGKTCNITWDRVCSNANSGSDCPASFDCDSPPSEHLAAYEVMMKKDTGEGIPYPNEDPNSKIGTVIARDGSEITKSGLTNGQKYYFLPVSVDGNGNYPPKPSPYPEGILCIPGRELPPAEPVMNSVSCDGVARTPSWGPVIDEERITFNLYRCEGVAEECTSEEQFAVVAEDIVETTLEYADGGVDSELDYTYCVAAIDPYENESALIGEKNCMSKCKGTDIVDQPAFSDCMAIQDNTGCRFWYGASPDDDDSYAGDAGYSIYL